MTPDRLSRTLLQALRHAVAAGELPQTAAELPDRVTLRNPPRGDADYASNLALRLAPATGHPAPRIAGILCSRLAQEPGIERVEVAGPGFLNITLTESGWTALVRRLATPATDGDALDSGTEPAARVRRLPEDPAADAARWAAVTGTPVHHERRDSRPLFRVQYAHARTHALLTGGRALGLTAEPGGYTCRAEATLLALLADHDRVTEQVAADRRTARDPRACAPLARHLTAVADAFTEVATATDRPILPRGDEKPEAAHRSRLALAAATGTVLAGGLTQLGISAPNHL